MHANDTIYNYYNNNLHLLNNITSGNNHTTTFHQPQQQTVQQQFHHLQNHHHHQHNQQLEQQHYVPADKSVQLVDTYTLNYDTSVSSSHETNYESSNYLIPNNTDHVDPTFPQNSTATTTTSKCNERITLAQWHNLAHFTALIPCYYYFCTIWLFSLTF